MWERNVGRINPGETLRNTQSCHHEVEAIVKRVATAARVLGVAVVEVAESVAAELDAIQVQALDETYSFGGCHEREDMQPALDRHVAQVDKHESRVAIGKGYSDSVRACSSVAADHSSCVYIRLVGQDLADAAVVRMRDCGRRTIR